MSKFDSKYSHLKFGNSKFIAKYGAPSQIGGRPGTTDGTPATPTLGLLSAASDNTPDFSVTGDLRVGDVIRFQYDTHSNFSAPTDVTNTIDAGEDAANELDFSTGALADGLTYFRVRIERGAANSLWSNTVSETIDTVAPTISGALSPADGATGVALNSNFVITFSKAIQAGATASVRLHLSSDNSVVEELTQVEFGGKLVISGSALTINWSSDLLGGTAYYVKIDAGSVKDLAGNSFAGITNTTTWNITSVATAYAPGSDANLVFRVVSDANVTITGGKVEAVQDQSSNAYVFSRTGTDTMTSDAGQLNSRPGISHPGSTCGLKTTLDAVALNSTTFSCFWMVRSNSNSINFGLLMALYGSGLGATGNHYDNNKSCVLNFGGTATPQEANGYANNGFLGSADAHNAFTFGTARSIGLIFDGTLVHFYIGGVEQGTGTSWTTALGNSLATIMIGCDHDAGSGGKFTWFEGIGTTTVVTASQMMAYFDAQWGQH